MGSPSPPPPGQDRDPHGGDPHRPGPPGPPGPPGTPPDGGRRMRIPLWYIIVPLVLLLAIYMAGTTRKEIPYGRFRTMLVETPEKIHYVTLMSDKVIVQLEEKDERGRHMEFYAVRVTPDDDLPTLLHEHLDERWKQKRSWMESPFVFWLLPLAFILILWRFIMGRMNPVGGAMDFSQSRAHMVAQREVGISFEDVAGIPECKEELEEIVEFLRNPSKFTRLGGKIPKGVLLVGPPGTGKTLLAKAVAGEAGVTFFSLSGSDFVELFVGVGAARVRDLFSQATKNAPCIVFIDELDALGKARGGGIMGGHDEREQTLNALLVQMDGFPTQKGVILLAATNRPEMLDPALLRPGRFDRHVVVPTPDLRDREEILSVHVRDVKTGDEVDLHRIAAMTPGFVGADIANLVNEATLLAARRDKNEVGMTEFEDSLERVVAGLEKRSRLMNSREKRIVAHHEAGHALVASLLEGADPVRKISMIPRGVAALGYTLQMPTEDRYLLRKSELMDRMAVMLGGRTAEQAVFDEVSTGAGNDLQRATELAREMVMEFGMSKELGAVSYGTATGREGPGGLPVSHPMSERTARLVDDAVRAIVDAAERSARELIDRHRDALLALAEALIEKETVEEEKLRSILARFGIEPVYRTTAGEMEHEAGGAAKSAGEPTDLPVAPPQTAEAPQPTAAVSESDPAQLPEPPAPPET